MLADLPKKRKKKGLLYECLTKASDDKAHGTSIGKWSSANHDEGNGEPDGHVAVEQVRLRHVSQYKGREAKAFRQVQAGVRQYSRVYSSTSDMSLRGPE